MLSTTCEFSNRVKSAIKSSQESSQVSNRVKSANESSTKAPVMSSQAKSASRIESSQNPGKNQIDQSRNAKFHIIKLDLS